jgi:cell division septation protein DedD
MLKAFFVLLLVAFGATLFVAGALAPASVKAPLESLAAQVAAQLSVERAKHAGVSVLPNSATLAVATSGATAAAAASGTVYAASTPMADLLVPAVLPANGHYALQAASFTSNDAAELFASSVKARGYKATIVPVSDADKSLIVAVGDYASPDSASADQILISQQLKSTVLPPVVLLPAPQGH